MGRMNKNRWDKFGSNCRSCCLKARARVRSCMEPWTKSVCNNCLHFRRTNLSIRLFTQVKKRNLKRKDDDDGELTELEDTKDEECDDTEVPVSKFTGKKKGGSNNALRASNFEALKEDDDGELTELEDTKDEECDETEVPVSKFTGKKKGGSNNALSASNFGILGEGNDEDKEDSEITKRMLIMKNQDNEVAGFAPSEKQITELLKAGKDKRALKVAKRKLGTQKRAKKREETAFVLRKMRWLLGVAGFAPSEKQITELLKAGKDKRALKVAKRKLGTQKRAKKREETAFVLRKMRAVGGGEKKLTATLGFLSGVSRFTTYQRKDLSCLAPLFN